MEILYYYPRKAGSSCILNTFYTVIGKIGLLKNRNKRNCYLYWQICFTFEMKHNLPHMLKNSCTLLAFIILSAGSPFYSNASGFAQRIVQSAEEVIELSFDKEGKLNVKTAYSNITLVRLFNQDGRKIIVKADGSSKELTLKDKLPSGSSWYVQIKTVDGSSSLRKIKAP